MKDNTLVYFILALMCILIGAQFTYISGNSGMLIGLGVIILLGLMIKFIHSVITYAADNDKEEDLEKE